MDDNDIKIYDINERTVSGCIRAIRTSSRYDDVSVELFKQLAGKDNPPYSEWVETWLIKCITEYSKTAQKGAIKRDVLFASFALLPEYTLKGTTVKERLDYYLYHSDYLKIYPSKSKRSIEEITDEKELKKIQEKLEKFDRACLLELIGYIETIPSPRSHIEDLEGYGNLIELSKVKVYHPFEQKLNYPKMALLSPNGNKRNNTPRIDNNCYYRYSYEFKQILSYCINSFNTSELPDCIVQETFPLLPNTGIENMLSMSNDFDIEQNSAIEVPLGVMNHEAIAPKSNIFSSAYDDYLIYMSSIKFIKSNPSTTKSAIVGNNNVYTIYFHVKKKSFNNFYAYPPPLLLHVIIQNNPSKYVSLGVRIGYPTMPLDNGDPAYSKEEGYIYFYNDIGSAFHLEYIYGSMVLNDPKINVDGKLPLCDYSSYTSNYFEDLRIEYGEYESNRNIPGHMISSNSRFKMMHNLNDSRISPYYQFDSYISFKVKVIYDATFGALMALRTVNTDQWFYKANIKIGDEVELILVYINTGKSYQSGVTIYVELPSCLEYIRNSTLFYSSISDTLTPINHDRIVDTAGFDIGCYSPGEGAIVHLFLKSVMPKYTEERRKIYNTSTYICVMKITVSETTDERWTTVELIS